MSEGVWVFMEEKEMEDRKNAPQCADTDKHSRAPKPATCTVFGAQPWVPNFKLHNYFKPRPGSLVVIADVELGQHGLIYHLSFHGPFCRHLISLAMCGVTLHLRCPG